MVGEAGVQYLADPRDGGLPARTATGMPDRTRAGAAIAGSYKTVPGAPAYGRRHASAARLGRLCLRRLNLTGAQQRVVAASGTAFGFRGSARLVAGTALGVGAMALVAAVGLGVVVTAAPAVGLAMKVAASAYLLYLAWQVAGARALERGVLARPLGIRQAVAFQVVNPKAWVVVVGAVGAFRPTGTQYSQPAC